MELHPALTAAHLTCSHLLREEKSQVTDMSIGIHRKAFCQIVGPRGSGKNLLLRLLCLLVKPDDGDVIVEGRATRDLREEERAGIRNQQFAFVFAAPFLLPGMSMVENIAMPLFKNSPLTTGQAEERIEAVLEFTRLMHHMHSAVEDLTNAEQQRASLARALILAPKFLFVEDMDGELAGQDLNDFAGTLCRATLERDVTVIATVETERMMPLATQVIRVAGGRIVPDTLPCMELRGEKP